MQRDMKQPEDASKSLLCDDASRSLYFRGSEVQPYFASRYDPVTKCANISQCELECGIKTNVQGINPHLDPTMSRIVAWYVIGMNLGRWYW